MIAPIFSKNDRIKFVTAYQIENDRWEGRLLVDCCSTSSHRLGEIIEDCAKEFVASIQSRLDEQKR